MLAAVAVSSTVDGGARQVKHPLATVDEDRLQQRRRPAQKVRGHHALSTQGLDLLVATLYVLLLGFDPAREDHFSLFVQDTNPMECLPDIEAHPVAHL